MKIVQITVVLCIVLLLQGISQNVGIGTATPLERLDVSGNLRFSGALMPGGNAGTTGQILVSQGAGVAPIWSTVAGSQITSVSLSGYREGTTTTWSTVTGMTLTFTARATSAYVMFSASGYGYTNSMSYVQFRVFNVTTNTSVVETNEKIQSYDNFTGTVTTWSCSANRLLTGLTVGTNYTLRVDWLRNGILGTYNPVVDTAQPGHHMTLSVIQ
ncbi:MAG: hypothetical protein NZ519_01145 [Bacteroidia bacterium]|nr:hypothetical protein [Bacteroidia bacterium]MDW8301171.1 hypothetical protein [Bacteroidia bacterium]